VVRFVAGAAASCVAVNAAATLALGAAANLPPDALWGAYARRLGAYAGAEVLNRIGVANLLQAFGGGHPGWLGGVVSAGLAGLLLAALCRRPLPLARQAVLALLFTPVLFTLSHYYYLMLALLFAAGERRLRWLAIWLFATNAAVIAANVAHVPYGLTLKGECLSYSLALALAPVVLFIVGWRDADARAPVGIAERADPAAPDDAPRQLRW
jgi:hypothetical protein